MRWVLVGAIAGMAYCGLVRQPKDPRSSAAIERSNTWHSRVTEWNLTCILQG